MKLPKTTKGIQSRIKNYEDYLKYEKRTYGGFIDGGGVRYMIGPLYVLMGDFTGALKAFRLFKRRFPDDSGEPFHNLQWALALYKSEKYKEAEAKLINTMFSNLYLVPYIFGEDIPPYEFQHFSNFEEKDTIEYLPEEFLNLWDDESKEWAKSVYYKPETIQLREKYIDLKTLLTKEPVGKKRSELVNELSNLKYNF